MTRLEVLQLIVIFSGLIHTLAGLATFASGRIARGAMKWIVGAVLMASGINTLLRAEHVLTWHGRDSAFIGWALTIAAAFIMLYLMRRLERYNDDAPLKTMTFIKTSRRETAAE